MLNQFTGIAKVIGKKVYFNPLEGYNVINFSLKLCSGETEKEYIFKGTEMSAIYDNEDRKRFDKYDKIEINDIVAFKGHFTTYESMIMTIDSIKIV